MKALIYKRLILASIAMSCFWQPCNGEELKAPIWTGVDVITNDPYSRDVVQSVIRIKPGAVISYDDPVLHLYCENVRNLLPTRAVRCRAVQMDGGTALYSVDVQTTKKRMFKKIACNSERLKSDLVNAANTYYSSQASTLATGGSFGAEFINAEGYLDFRGASAHELHRATHQATVGRFADLARGTTSCVASDRADSIWLMNFSGLQHMTFGFALRLLDDSDEAVRNNASRTVASFVDYMPASKAQFLLDHACRKIREENFYERNKGLSMAERVLRTMRERKLSVQLPCASLVADIAAQSKSGQIGEIAKAIVRAPM